MTQRCLESKSVMIYDVAINDSDYTVRPLVNGKRAWCPIYKKWRNMIERCYSKGYQKNNTTYKECSVCHEWLTFSKFKSWMIKQDWESKHLDKDIIKPGNKIYSPSFCAFVDQETNNLLVTVKSRRGDYPQGISFHKQSGKFRARIHHNGKYHSLGVYETVKDASMVYIREKVKVLKEASVTLNDVRVSSGLMLHANFLERNGVLYGG